MPRRALHEDFGVHDSTPQRSSPNLAQLADSAPGEASGHGLPCPHGPAPCASPFAARSLAASACGSEDGGGAAEQSHSLDAALWALDEHAASGGTPATATRSARPPLPLVGTPASPCTPHGAAAATPPDVGFRGATSLDGVRCHQPSRLSLSGGAHFPRAASIESDNQSLGFGAREVLANLRDRQTASAGAGASAEASPEGGLPRALTQTQLSELDPKDWEVAAATPGRGEKQAGGRRAGDRRQWHGGGCRMH